MKKRINTKKIIFLLFLMAASAYIIRNNYEKESGKKNANIEIKKATLSKGYTKATGRVFGTTASIIYGAEKDYCKEIEDVLFEVDSSLSPFNKNSIITAMNENTGYEANEMFCKVFTLAHEVSERTGGAFDITVAPLVNAWGFGFRQGCTPDSASVDSLCEFVDYRKVTLEGGTITKQNPRIMLDCSAIAKGYGCDVVAELLEKKGVKNYMVEIGGEIVAKGKNAEGKTWTIGINKPVDDPTASNNELYGTITLNGKGMATSGNYRNYRIENGRKVAHTIDPRTGYPVEHSLLSATVIADNCAKADAYATSFMVMGVEKAMELCESDCSIEGFFIYADSTGSLNSCQSRGFKEYLITKK